MIQEKYKIGQFGPDLGLKLNRNRVLIDANLSDATVIVKQASDLGGTLSSAYRYIVDGAVDMGSQSITVPEGGLFIAGLGFGISSLTSSADNYNMFITGATFSGDLFLDGVDTGVTGTNSQIFELDNDSNFGAVEYNNGNILAGSTIGNLTNYRQFVMSNVAIFAITDGLTFTGAWAGGVAIIDTICIGVGAGVTIFKAGVGLVFSGSIRSNINALSINATTTIFDFTTGNIANDGAFSLTDARFNKDSNPVPNITGADVRARFRNCTGVGNTYAGSAYVFTSAVSTGALVQGTPVKMPGATAYSDEYWFSNSGNNRAVFDSDLAGEYEVAFNLSFTGTNNVEMGVQIRQWDNSASLWIDVGSEFIATLNGGPAGTRAEGVSGFAYCTLDAGDYIEIWIVNNTNTTGITPSIGGSVIIKERSS